MKTRDQINQRVRCTPIRLLLAVGMSCLLLQNANAAQLFTEAFNYATGTLSGQVNPGNSTAWSAAGSNLIITNANLTYSGLLDLGGNALLITNGAATSSVNTFANQTAGTVYYSFLFQPLVLNAGNSYFTALNPGTTAPNGGSDAIDAYYYSTGKIQLRANAAAATAGTGPVLTIGTTYFIVEMIDLTAKTASLWINPTPGAAAPATTAFIPVTTATAVADVGFKGQSTAAGSFVIDNLLIGTAWEDVTTAIPEPSTLALATAGIGLMFAMIRRRRS